MIKAIEKIKAIMKRHLLRKLIFNLVVVLLLAYGVIMTVISFNLARRVGALGRDVSFLSLIRQDLEERLKRVSNQIQYLETENVKVQKDIEILDIEAEKKMRDKSSILDDYKEQVKNLKEELSNAQEELTLVKEESLRLEGFQSQTQGKAKEVVKLKEELLHKGNQIRELKIKIENLEEEVKDKEATLHYNLAVNFTYSQNIDNAIIEYEKAVGINPNHAKSHYNLGILYEEYKKDFAQATYHYRKYLSLKSEAEDAREVRRWILELEARLLSSPTP